MIFQELPLPPEIGAAPELASLAILDTVLEVAGSALVAANPEIGCIDENDIVSGQACITEALLAHAEAMPRGAWPGGPRTRPAGRAAPPRDRRARG